MAEEALRDQIACEERDILERRTVQGVVLADLRLENLALKSRFRRLGRATLHASFFSESEREMSQLHSRVETLRASLLASYRSLLEHYQSHFPSATGTVSVINRQMDQLESKSKSLREEKRHLEGLKRRDCLGKKEWEEASIRLVGLYKENREKNAALESEKLSLQEYRARMQVAQDKVMELREMENNLEKERLTTEGEVEELRTITGMVVEEQARESALDRLVTKHVRMIGHSSYLPKSEKADPETTRKEFNRMLEELATIEDKLEGQMTCSNESPILLMAKLRTSLERLRIRILDTLKRESQVSEALSDYSTER